MKTLWTIPSAFLICAVLFSACAAIAPKPTPTPTIPPTITPSPTPIPPTATPTPIPPTATNTPIPLILTDGTQKWIITSVTISDTSQYTPPSGFYLVEGYVYLTVELESQDNADLVAAVMKIDASGIIKFSVPGGIKMVYVTDSGKNKYYAVEVAQSYVIVPVPKNSSGFTLYVLDWDPVDLGK